MKYKYFLLPIAGMFIIAAIFVSCSKQDQTELTSSPPEISQSKADILIENKIRAFKSKLGQLRENPQFKSGETIEVDSAVWYMTASLNYTYARAGSDFANIISDSTKITVPTNGEELLLDDLPAVYQQFLDSLRAKYHAIQSVNKNLIMVNMIAEETTENGTEVTLYSATGEGTPTYTYGLFGAEDYWYWWYELGKCGNFIGQNVVEDATTQLQYRINNPNITYPPGTYFIPDPTNTGWIGPEEYEDPNSPNGYYRLFYDETIYPPTEEPCIPPDDMNYYLYDGVAYIMEDNKPAGKYLTFGEVRGDITTGIGYELRVHEVRFTYGRMYISEDPTEDL